MSGDGTDPPEGTEGTDPPAGNGGLDALNERVGRIEDAVERLVSGAHTDAQRTTQARLDAPGSVSAEVRAELERRDAKTKGEQAAAELENLKTTVAQLAEKPPEEPVRRVERFMGWR